MASKKRITINLSDSEYKTLRALAEKSDRSVAWWGRRAISDLLTSGRTDEKTPFFQYKDLVTSSARDHSS
ncbi:MAG: hypothetical protein COC17_01255 [Hyphomicrobiales bacterium]|nr:MAG: hypothetical protein COC17_01255 [Hyphomicrobiales bacterium]